MISGWSRRLRPHVEVSRLKKRDLLLSSSPLPLSQGVEDGGTHGPQSGRLAAVETHIFPLYEIFDGLEYTINHASKNLPVETLSLQGRYERLGPKEIESVQAETDRAWNEPRKRAGCSSG